MDVKFVLHSTNTIPKVCRCDGVGTRLPVSDGVVRVEVRQIDDETQEADNTYSGQSPLVIAKCLNENKKKKKLIFSVCKLLIKYKRFGILILSINTRVSPFVFKGSVKTTIFLLTNLRPLIGVSDIQISNE